MDERIIQTLENLIYEKIILYNDLLHCLEKERETLIKIDMDDLWEISKEKEEICSKVSAVRQEIISTLDLDMDLKDYRPSRILDSIPRASRARFQQSYVRLINLKTEIEAIRKENMILINDSLQFLDEMVSVITGNDQNRMTYRDDGHIRKSAHQMLLSREV
jgi:flagellar biosynthesis/type III secretory pathway chaperone